MNTKDRILSEITEHKELLKQKLDDVMNKMKDASDDEKSEYEQKKNDIQNQMDELDKDKDRDWDDDGKMESKWQEMKGKLQNMLR